MQLGSKQKTDLEGILLVNKPTGCTSHDVVDRMRRKLRMKRIGHAGTLDPLATGLLILLIGKATKASQYLISLDKKYEATMLLGKATDSHDSDGEVTQDREVPEMSVEEIEAVMKTFLGDQYQTPPMFSAKKVNGVPLYKLARKGKTIEREHRFIRVSEFSLKGYESPELKFSLRCSKGTYVRKIANDLGEKLGCGGHMTQLHRTATNHMTINQATDLAELEGMEIESIRNLLLPVHKAVPQQIL